jgi:hypothetical protein
MKVFFSMEIRNMVYLKMVGFTEHGRMESGRMALLKGRVE